MSTRSPPLRIRLEFIHRTIEDIQNKKNQGFKTEQGGTSIILLIVISLMILQYLR